MLVGVAALRVRAAQRESAARLLSQAEPVERGFGILPKNSPAKELIIFQ
jgi:hypothetical protein